MMVVRYTWGTNKRAWVATKEGERPIIVDFVVCRVVFSLVYLRHWPFVFGPPWIDETRGGFSSTLYPGGGFRDFIIRWWLTAAADLLVPMSVTTSVSAVQILVMR